MWESDPSDTKGRRRRAADQLRDVARWDREGTLVRDLEAVGQIRDREGDEVAGIERGEAERGVVVEEGEARGEGHALVVRDLWGSSEGSFPLGRDLAGPARDTRDAR